MKKHFLTAIIVSFSAILIAQAPAGYYDAAIEKTGTELRLALNSIIYNHTNVGYSGLWTLYQSTDLQPGTNKIWDIYSNCNFTYRTDQCGNYRNVCDCYNREHSVPESWFSGAQPMYADAFHLYPTDGKVNGQRSNFPYGECANGSSLGGAALGKLGSSTFSGYSSTVFEPIDEYKGDLARTYFYMATCYLNQNFTSGEGAVVFSFNNSDNPKTNLTSYSINLFLKWTRQDPVSQKEIDRNNAIFATQHNRNPFIDHPELAEYIWGNHNGDAWNTNADIVNIQAIPVKIIFNKENSSIKIISEQTFNQFSIVNLSGQMIASGTIDNNFIQLNPLANGLYLITLNTDFGKITQKLLVY
ncbi:MAG: endonuclease [Paludibacter sp.]|nr:endonuclease [Paludibacter sp.]